MLGRLAWIAAIAAAVLLLMLSPILWLAYLDPFGGAAHPSDDAMIAQFRRQRAELETLVAMIRQDPGLQRLAADVARPEDPAVHGVPAERIADYRRRLREAGIALGFSHYGHAIEFIVHGRGLAISGSGKSFVHQTRPDDNATIIDGDLDSAAVSLAKQNVYLQRRIDGHWWLQLDLR